MHFDDILPFHPDDLFFRLNFLLFFKKNLFFALFSYILLMSWQIDSSFIRCSQDSKTSVWEGKDDNRKG
jgi:hypothetical protein